LDAPSLKFSALKKEREAYEFVPKVTRYDNFPALAMLSALGT